MSEREASRPSRAADERRSTVKWGLASAFALLSLLLGAVPASSISNRDVSVARLTFSLGVVALASLLLIAILVRSVRVFEPVPQTLRELIVWIDRPPHADIQRDLLRDLSDNAYFLLRGRFDGIRGLWNAARTVGELRNDEAEATLAQIDDAELRTLDYVDSWLASRQYEVAGASLRRFGPWAFASFLLLGWVVLSAPRTIELQRITPLSVQLQPSRKDLWRLKLLQNCKYPTVRGASVIAASRDFSRYRAVLPADARCSAVHAEFDSARTPFQLAEAAP